MLLPLLLLRLGALVEARGQAREQGQEQEQVAVVGHCHGHSVDLPMLHCERVKGRAHLPPRASQVPPYSRCSPPSLCWCNQSNSKQQQATASHLTTYNVHGQARPWSGCAHTLHIKCAPTVLPCARVTRWTWKCCVSMAPRVAAPTACRRIHWYVLRWCTGHPLLVLHLLTRPARVSDLARLRLTTGSICPTKSSSTRRRPAVSTPFRQCVSTACRQPTFPTRSGLAAPVIDLTLTVSEGICCTVIPTHHANVRMSLGSAVL